VDEQGHHSDEEIAQALQETGQEDDGQASQPISLLEAPRRMAKTLTKVVAMPFRTPNQAVST
jgi:hypothetical protein